MSDTSAPKDSGTQTAHGTDAKPTAPPHMAFWYDSQHRDLLFYLSIAIFMLELIVGAVAFFYGVIHALPDPNGGPPRFQFPWLAYGIAAILAPAALLLIVHLAGVGLFRSLRQQDQDEAWQKDLPERLRKVYAVIQGAPTVVLLIGILLLGVALFYLDGAVGALMAFGRSAGPYLPWVAGGIIAAWCVAYVARIWLTYRTKKLEAEYQFRREVLERTGVIIVEQGGMRLPAAHAHGAPQDAQAIDVSPAGTLPPAPSLEPSSGPSPESPSGAETPQPATESTPCAAPDDAHDTAKTAPVIDVTASDGVPTDSSIPPRG